MRGPGLVGVGARVLVLGGFWNWVGLFVCMSAG